MAHLYLNRYKRFQAPLEAPDPLDAYVRLPTMHEEVSIAAQDAETQAIPDTVSSLSIAVFEVNRITKTNAGDSTSCAPATACLRRP